MPNMAGLRERTKADGTKYWQVRYRIDGGQASTSVANESEARELVALMAAVGVDRALLAYGLERPARAERTGMTVNDWLDRHIKNLTGVEQKSIDDYIRYKDRDIAPTLGEIPLASLTREDIAAWVQRMETEISPKTGRVVTPKTIRNRHGFLSGALKAAVVAGHIPSNPAEGRRLPRKTGDGDGDGEGEDIRTLSRDEYRLLLGNTTEYWRPLVEFLVAAGCRWGEASALKPSDVDLDAGTVKIRRAWKHNSKGYSIGPPKTKRSRRTINIPPDVLNQLDYSHEWLFVNRSGGPVRYQGFRRRVWDKAVERAGLNPPPTPHALRHTCASWMLAAGVPLTTVSRHLGHENIQITADIYTDVDRTAFAAAADVMGKLLS